MQFFESCFFVEALGAVLLAYDRNAALGVDPSQNDLASRDALLLLRR